MQLVNFSVTNYRSITTAHKASISNTTILIGRNNEGKSNLLKALDVGMTALQPHTWEFCYGKPIRGRWSGNFYEYIEVFYNRERIHSTNDYLSPVEYEKQQKSI